MPQELYVLRCFSCQKFQVQIVKKIPKWKCNVCNEKQSVLKIYAQGSGKECRQYVQQVNFIRGNLENAPGSYQTPISLSENLESASSENSKIVNAESKWSQYLDNQTDFQASDENTNEKDQDTTLLLSASEDREIFSKYSSKNRSSPPSDSISKVNCKSMFPEQSRSAYSNKRKHSEIVANSFECKVDSYQNLPEFQKKSNVSDSLPFNKGKTLTVPTVKEKDSKTTSKWVKFLQCSASEVDHDETLETKSAISPNYRKGLLPEYNKNDSSCSLPRNVDNENYCMANKETSKITNSHRVTNTLNESVFNLDNNVDLDTLFDL